jgi:peptide/nickel transport system ATP-binding protein
MSLLEVTGLTTRFTSDLGAITAVDAISFTLERGETLAIVGESGSGKTTAALSLIRLAPVAQGSVRFEGRDLLTLDEHAMLSVRGDKIGMVFQEPMTSLNPVLSVGEQIAESLRAHRGLSSAAAFARAAELLALVGIPNPTRRVHEFPHTLSGGMRQRAMIAMAIACEPSLLIADEPTTALDVTVQAQILDLFRDLQRRFAMGLVLITHDLGVVAELADRVLVMYAGRIVEETSADELFARPRHPYTEGLLRATLGFDDGGEARLSEIPGQPPSLTALPAGCAFAPRCPRADARCRAEAPALSRDQGRAVACHHAAA